MGQHRIRRSVATVLVVPLLFAAACSSGSALCSSIDDLSSNLQALRDVSVLDDGVDALTEQVDALKASFADVKQEASDTFSDDVGNVETSLTAVDAVVQQLKGGTPVTDLAGDATTAISGLVSSVQALVQAVQDQECN